MRIDRARLLGVAGVTAVLATVTACSQPTTATASAADATAPVDCLVGEWTMTSLEPTGDQGEAVDFSGQVIFTDAGTMSVQAMNPDPAAPDGPYTVSGYEAVYGPVSVDPDAGTAEVDVESAAVRDLIGQQLTRQYEVSDDILVLTPTARMLHQRGRLVPSEIDRLAGQLRTYLGL